MSNLDKSRRREAPAKLNAVRIRQGCAGPNLVSNNSRNVHCVHAFYPTSSSMHVDNRRCTPVEKLQIPTPITLATDTGIWRYESVAATGFEPTTSRTRSKRSFLNDCTLDELNVARSYEAQTTPRRRRSALIDEAVRSSAPFAFKIGCGSGTGRDSGSDAGELPARRSECSKRGGPCR
jgi:hypothetical protein